jgi:hypothetical protein
MTSEEVGSYAAHSLAPGPVLQACDTQDITRKGAKKNKSHVLMILPQHFAFDKSCDHEVGTLEDANTNTPTFVIKTAKQLLRFPGKFVSTSTAFFTLDCVPKSQSVLSEMYQFVLVFGKPSMQPLSAADKVRDVESMAKAAPTVSSEASSPASLKVEGPKEWMSQHGLSANVPGKAAPAPPKKRAKAGAGAGGRNWDGQAGGGASDSDTASMDAAASDADSIPKAQGKKTLARAPAARAAAAAAPRRSTGRRACVREASQSTFYGSSSEDDPTSDVSDSDDTDDYEDSPVRKRRR